MLSSTFFLLLTLPSFQVVVSFLNPVRTTTTKITTTCHDVTRVNMKHLQQIHRYHMILFASSKPSSSSTTAPSSSSSRQNQLQKLIEWGDQMNIQISKSYIAIKNDLNSGLGWYCTKQIPSGSVLLTVPSNVAITVEAPGEGPNNRAVIETYGKRVTSLPWYAQLSLYLNTLRRLKDNDKWMSYQIWIYSLPTSFNTPFHWNNEILQNELQYDYMTQSVQQQQSSWKKIYHSLDSTTELSYDDFIWGCECARSRTFSGMFSGSGFNPSMYAFVLLLMTLYVGFNIGTIEQAANGGGLVINFSILKDFVLPKIFKKKRYVICPFIDITNHQSTNYQADVSLEFFLNTYSLAAIKEIPSGEQIYISYGPRSNDQLLQYYGFVESNNPYDIYVMPSLRNWNIEAIEKSCGRIIVSSRLLLLEKAGLLGSKTKVDARINVDDDDDDDDDTTKGNVDGIIVTYKNGVDPAAMQAIRVLIATDKEWIANGESINNFAEVNSAGIDNEACMKLAAIAALQHELAMKPTTLQQDISLLNNNKKKGTIDINPEEVLAIQYRIEKKKLLQKWIDAYQSSS